MEKDYDLAPKGWICPKCGRVYAPSQPLCLYCGGDDEVTVSTTYSAYTSAKAFINYAGVKCHQCIYHTNDDECTHPHWQGDSMHPVAMESDYCSYGERKDE